MEPKEIEHRACLVERPSRSGPEPFWYDVNAESVRLEGNRFGLEVIDISYIRNVFYAISRKLASDEQMATGAMCESCGVTMRHAHGCPTTRTP